MFVIEITYIRPLDEVERHIEAHRQFLKQHYDSGVFIMSGVKVPRDGGVIIANGHAKADIEAIMVTDPFAKQKLANYTMTQFDASRHQIENFIT